MFERIVVALDGSALAEGALAVGEELARRLGVPLHLVRVADTTWLRFGANEAALEYAALGGELNAEEAQAGDYLEGIRARLAGEAGQTGSGREVTVEVRRGFAGRELVAVARPNDLLVMAPPASSWEASPRRSPAAPPPRSSWSDRRPPDRPRCRGDRRAVGRTAGDVTVFARSPTEASGVFQAVFSRRSAVAPIVAPGGRPS